MSFETIEVEAGACGEGSPRFAVIWLHGLGADASDFESIPSALKLKHPTRFIFPNAPVISVTINGGIEARAWYDILQADHLSRVIDVAGLHTSCEQIRCLIKRENARGIPGSNIFVAGFSQGGAVAYYTGLTHPEPLAGVIALSSYVPAPLLQGHETPIAPTMLPIFTAHGEHDLVVSLAFAQQSVGYLVAHGYAPSWQTYPIDHSVSIAEIRSLSAWMHSVIESQNGV